MLLVASFGHAESCVWRIALQNVFHVHAVDTAVGRCRRLRRLLVSPRDVGTCVVRAHPRHRYPVARCWRRLSNYGPDAADFGDASDGHDASVVLHPTACNAR